ncbi:conserved hypothetical protein [Sulfurihydrogenibium azorense Az-Fu1]|uniref:Transposase (putative) YhgA-like domain-containing protein n=3 Tax=Sulfurihydrogenibium azorense TaxID=309806 RepID=C1DX95_SULAA|nr:conserved hypothetical protein [Sulfurihydrogenibium azorense Az-Fu1]
MMEEDERLSRPYRPVIPIVFYHGEKPWNIPTKIPQLKNIKENLRDYIHSLSYILFDTSKVEDTFLVDKLYANACLMSAIYTMKNIFKDLQSLKPILEKLILADVKDCLYIIIDYTVIIKKDLETIEKVLEEIGGEEKMMTLTEKWKMEGLKKGMEEGLKKGIEQGLQQGLQQGLVEGLRQSIFDAVELKFGYVEDALKEKISRISDVDLLKEIHRKIILAKSLNDIII